MWFRNLVVFRLPSPWPVSADWLEERMQRRVLVACGALERDSRGWLAARRGLPLVHAVGGAWLLCMGHEQRLLPAPVIAEEVRERAEAIEAEQGFRPGRRQLRELKDRVIDELMPRAFVRRGRQWLWIDPADGWLVADAASDARAEQLIELLRDTVDELPVRRVDTERAPVSAMTEWLASGDAPAGFSLDRELELRAADEEKATVRYVRHALEGPEIAAHIAGGKRATRLAMTWRDRVSFVLTEQWHLRRLQFLDVVRERLDDREGDADGQFDTQFSLMAGELAALLPELCTALGGERQAA